MTHARRLARPAR